MSRKAAKLFSCEAVKILLENSTPKETLSNLALSFGRFVLRKTGMHVVPTYKRDLCDGSDCRTYSNDIFFCTKRFTKNIFVESIELEVLSPVDVLEGPYLNNNLFFRCRKQLELLLSSGLFPVVNSL